MATLCALPIWQSAICLPDAQLRLAFSCREEIDDAPTIEVLDKIRNDISKQIDAIIQKLGEVYDEDQDLEATKKYAVELQYMVKCAEEIDAKEEKLEENA